MNEVEKPQQQQQKSFQISATSAHAQPTQTNICCEHLSFLLLLLLVSGCGEQQASVLREREGAALIVMLGGVEAALPALTILTQAYTAASCRVGPLKHHTLHTADINHPNPTIYTACMT